MKISYHSKNEMNYKTMPNNNNQQSSLTFYKTSSGFKKPSKTFRPMSHNNSTSNNRYHLHYNTYDSTFESDTMFQTKSHPVIFNNPNPPTDESSCKIPRMVQICQNNLLLKEELRLNSWKYPKPQPKKAIRKPSRLMNLMMRQFFPY